jgi:predicted chitinase
MFIQHMKNCLWLDKGELARIYPDENYRPYVKTGFLKTSLEQLRERYRAILNRTARKYLVTTPARLAHFLGQGAVESRRMATMMETTADPGRSGVKLAHPSLQPETNGYHKDPNDTNDSFQRYDNMLSNLGNVEKSIYKKGGKIVQKRPVSPADIDAADSTTGDGMKFRGRGFKQITGRANYSRYWVFRNWLRPGIDFDENWWADVNKRKAAIIDNPQLLSVDDYASFDASGWFWIYKKMNSFIHGEDVSDATVKVVTKKINGADNALQDRIDATRQAARILLDGV